MSTYYADLNAVVPGAGTAISPWDADQFKTNARLTLPSNSIVKVTGSYDYGSGFPSYISFIAAGGSGTTQVPITFEAWNPLTPPRIKTELFQAGWGATVKNFIIESSDFLSIVEGTTMLDCQLKAVNRIELLANSTTSVNTIKGCTLTSVLIKCGSPSTYSNNNLVDSIIDGTLAFYGITNSINCAFTASSIPAGGTHVQEQTGWIAPPFPAWNDPQINFSSSILGVGLHTPPLPGAPPYIGYDRGLFDSVRTGIGAFYFDTIPLVIGTRYIAKVTANGWIKDYIYEWDGTQWTATPPVEGACVVIKELFDLYIYLNGEWVENDIPWLDPVIEIFNNTTGLPVSPSNGDRYIALVTANSWTINGVYEWNGNNWVETLPVAGMIVFNNDTSEPLLYSGSAWNVFGSLTAHAIGGPLHTASSVTDLKTKVSGPDFLITSQAGEFSSLPQKDGTNFEDHVIIEDSTDSAKKKRVDVGKMTPWLYGTGAPPSTTGLVEGTLYIKYTP